MKRRKNFLLGSTATYEVRVYPYGKKNVRDDRNVKVRKFSGVSAAMRWAKVNLAYPEVEVVDLTSGRTVFAGGTGKTFNPRKKRKAPKRRDVYAEMAKSRKTTKGHKRKDRKRSVARGSSRKPKHKIRLNPFKYEKPNLGATAFDANVKKRQSKILGMYRGFLAALGREGVKKLPSAGEIRDDAMQGAVLIESTRYPELRSQSKEDDGAQAVAAEVLGVGPGGEFAAYVQDYPEIFELHLKDTVELLRKERKKLRAAELKDAKRIDKAREDFTQERATSKAAQIAAIEAKIEAKKSEIADYGDEDYEDEDEGELDPQTAAELAEVYEMTPGEEAEEEQLQEDAQREKAVKKGRKKRKKTVEYDEGEYTPPTAGMSKRKLERLGKYATHLTPVRRTDVQPPLNLLGKTRQDVLLYILKDGTTQVWMKGSMTVTFEPTGRIPSWTIAHRYANKWRGLSPSGSVRGPKEGELPVKKSRLRTGVYAAVEGQDKLKKIEDPINIVEKKDRTLKRKQYDMPDLDKYELIGDRANPRRRKNARWPEKIGRYKLRMLKTQGYGDDTAAYGPFRIKHNVYMPSPSDWHARWDEPDQWQVDMVGGRGQHLGFHSSPKAAVAALRYHLRRGGGRSPLEASAYSVQVSIGPSAGLTEKGREWAMEGVDETEFSFKVESTWPRVAEAVAEGLKRKTGDRWTVYSPRKARGGWVFEIFTSGHLGGTATVRRANPRRRKNTWHTETGKMTWKDWCAGIRSELRAYGGGWPMQDFKDEVSRLYRKPADEILKEFWRQDPTDPTSFVEGVATDLRFESRFPEHRISNPKRRKNVAFDKGKPEQNHPYANILRSEGFTYSHSGPVNHNGVKVWHHVYRLDGTDFYVSYYQEPLGTKWLWEGSVSGSGRMHQGFGMSNLNKYLRGAVPRHRTKVANPRRRKR